MPKRAGQSFDLAVAAVTIESMGVTPPPDQAHFSAAKEAWLPPSTAPLNHEIKNFRSERSSDKILDPRCKCFYRRHISDYPSNSHNLHKFVDLDFLLMFSALGSGLAGRAVGELLAMLFNSSISYCSICTN